MKKYIALCAVAAIVITSAGCTAVKKYEVDDEDLAYSRTLYPDGEYTDYYEEEDLFDEDGIEEDHEETEHRVEDDNKEDKKQKKEKKESKSEEKASSEHSSSSSSSSQPSSSKPSSSKSSSSSKTRTKWIKSLGAGSSKPSKSSDTDSEKKSAVSKEETSSSYTPKKREPVYMGEFRLIDLSYNAEKDYLDFNDKEDFVRDIMGEPLEESMSEDGELKYLTYEDCIITLEKENTEEAGEASRLEENEEQEEQQESKERYFLINILVPYESYYETFKFISTSFSASSVIDAYGEPTEIVDLSGGNDEEEEDRRVDDMAVPLFFEDEDEQTDSSQESSDSDTDAGENEEETSSDEDRSESEAVSDTEAVTESQAETKKPFTGDYLYKRGSKALIFHIENDEIMQIEYRWDR